MSQLPDNARQSLAGVVRTNREYGQTTTEVKP